MQALDAVAFALMEWEKSSEDLGEFSVIDLFELKFILIDEGKRVFEEHDDTIIEAILEIRQITNVLS